MATDEVAALTGTNTYMKSFPFTVRKTGVITPEFASTDCFNETGSENELVISFASLVLFDVDPCEGTTTIPACVGAPESELFADTLKSVIKFVFERLNKPKISLTSEFTAPDTEATRFDDVPEFVCPKGPMNSVATEKPRTINNNTANTAVLNEFVLF